MPNRSRAIIVGESFQARYGLWNRAIIVGEPFQARCSCYFEVSML
jgi:hypothetical protein